MPNIYHNVLEIYGSEQDLSSFKVWFDAEGINFTTRYEDIQLVSHKGKKLIFSTRTIRQPPFKFIDEVPEKFPNLLFALGYRSFDDYIEGKIIKRKSQIYYDFSLPILSELFPFDQKNAKSFSYLVDRVYKRVLRVAKSQLNS